jgi:hypothetical protein
MGVIVNSGAAVTLTNVEAVDPRRIVNDSIKQVEPRVIVQGVGGKPVKLAEMRAHKNFTINPKGINQITIQEENDHNDTSSQLTTSRLTTINSSDNHEVEVWDDLSPLASDNESEWDSEDDPEELPPPLMPDGDDDSNDETFIPKKGNVTQVIDSMTQTIDTGLDHNTMRHDSPINMGRISSIVKARNNAFAVGGLISGGNFASLVSTRLMRPSDRML